MCSTSGWRPRSRPRWLRWPESYPVVVVNAGVPLVHTARTDVLRDESSWPLWKFTVTSPQLEVSTRTRQSLSGWAFRSLIEAPVQRTETSPPGTLMLWSTGVGAGDGVGPGVVVRPAVGGVGACAGCRVGVEAAAGAGITTGAGVSAALAGAGAGVGAAGVGVLPGVGVPRDASGSALALAGAMSRPALSMATHAVADTPATANTQIAAMPVVERRLVTTSSCPTSGRTPNDTRGSLSIA